MLHPNGQGSPPSSHDHGWFHFALKWTPRAIVAGISGYYCLGIAYEMGIMAKIDRIAIRLLRPSMGYIGIGAFMPTFQWYSAWGVRMISGISGGLLYDLVERLVRAVFKIFSFESKRPLPPHSTSTPSSSPLLDPSPKNKSDR